MSSREEEVAMASFLILDWNFTFHYNCLINCTSGNEVLSIFFHSKLHKKYKNKVVNNTEEAAAKLF